MLLQVQQKFVADSLEQLKYDFYLRVSILVEELRLLYINTRSLYVCLCIVTYVINI